jgi:hypothetical protein
VFVENHLHTIDLNKIKTKQRKKVQFPFVLMQGFLTRLPTPLAFASEAKEQFAVALPDSWLAF